MEALHQMAAILFLWIVCVGCAIGCDVNDVAVYNVKVYMYWDEITFPKDYPTDWPKAQWSPVFGQSHNNSYALYHVGDIAKASVQEFARDSNLDTLVEEGDEESKVYDQFTAPAVATGSGQTENVVFVDGAHTMVSLICCMIPSPDWFIGVDSLNLCVDSTWVDQVTLDLEPLDAGAASGLTFTAPLWETTPREPVTRHSPKNSNHASSSFYYPLLRELPAIGKVEFVKIKEYSTKELNDIARNELLTKLTRNKGKDFNKKHQVKEHDTVVEYVTKNNVDELKDLEEDPIETYNNPADNKVIVVTKPTTTTTTTEAQMDSEELKNMDEVVLAVAKGRKLGLGKHLPRHFRSRLHHAVNRIQPNDCPTSEWSEWTSCSATCGYGKKFRYRSIIRDKTGHGRGCPELVDSRRCGSVNSCVQLDYVEW